MKTGVILFAQGARVEVDEELKPEIVDVGELKQEGYVQVGAERVYLLHVEGNGLGDLVGVRHSESADTHFVSPGSGQMIDDKGRRSFGVIHAARAEVR